MKITNFYEAAYLLGQQHFMSKIIRDENGKRSYYFDDNEDEIKNDIIKLRENNALQCFISGQILLRKFNDNFLKNEKEKINE